MNAKIKSTAMAVALAGLFAAQPAAADTLVYNGSSNGFISANISSPISRWVSAGGFNMTNTTPNPDVSFQAWCVDIFHRLTSPRSYTFQSGTSFYASDPGKATALSHLASNYLSSVTDSTTSGAFQLAVWEIANESSSGSYSLSNGNFQATSGNATAVSTASTWLNNLSGPITMTANVWATGSSQDLAVFAPVPEPQTYAMMLAGLGLMGFVARRRNQTLDANDA